jgi:hypothetical protein
MGKLLANHLADESNYNTAESFVKRNPRDSAPALFNLSLECHFKQASTNKAGFPGWFMVT